MTVQQIVTMLEATAGDSEGETRDYAIIVTFYATGLRVSELCGLNLHECDLVAGNAWIKGKGRKEKELVPLPAVVIAAIQRYLPYRGTAAGPLFLTRGNRGKHRDGRLETRSVLRIVRNLGRKVGIKVWCHGLRQTSISQAAELGGQRGLGLHKVLAHSRHSNLATLSTYLDNHDRAGTQRTLADLVAGALPPRLQP